ncbi:nucleoside-diphosphate-sugar epimerase [Kribbella aluminosa]|uniref:Nucleoside-diphosphate-sugar epimerase n=1 Tax=Kribbella aluminosa TaxID=416017 RepID=A0ABS4UIV1_9ACTN|nr:NAD-dependent epimerase/dehydratase family protein [Kribbella aluminosa]MBP2351538.1 nucleoside-diphosphate-sugar epimerase [Kribbella aluminosa]
MEILILGGTAFLGREIATQALARGHAVTCVARGESGAVADGATLVATDRSRPDAYDAVPARDWDAVFEVSWQPGFVKGALAAFGARAKHWTYVSSGNVYEKFDTPGADESAVLREPVEQDVADREQYGEAKVACERASLDTVGERLVIARAGLIGGPGDASDRAGAWVARAALAPEEPLLVPDTPDLATAVVDVRDLAGWLLDNAELGRTGTFDTYGPVVPFGEWIATAREVGGHTGPVVLAPQEWLEEQKVEQYMGPESLTMWITEAGYEGWSERSGSAAAAAGLTHRSRMELTADSLAWERELGLARERRAGLSLAKEKELIEALKASGRS